MIKWERAKNFTMTAHGGHNIVDLAYDGAFLKADIADFCAAVNASRPEWIFVDDEGWPGFGGWKQYANFSANAEARRVKHETDFDLAWRMMAETLHQWSSCLKGLPTASGGRTTIGYYGTNFEPGQFQPAGFVGMPSTYGAMKNLKDFAGSIRDYRREMLSVVDDDVLGQIGQLTEKRQLLPWLTACTYGQMTAVDVFAGTLHSFAGGASGFAFFADTCFDDPGKILALSTAAALAAPFEDLFFEGTTLSAPDQLSWSESDGNVLAAAGMQMNRTSWLVVTPTLPGMPVALTVKMPLEDAGTKLYICELLSGISTTTTVAADGGAEVKLSAPDGTVVLHIASKAGSCEATKLWNPKPITERVRMKHDDQQNASPANPELCGVNNGWVDPMSTLVEVNRDAQGHAGSWLPPKVSPWVNKSDPFNSPILNELLAGLQLGNYRYPGGGIAWDWHRENMSPLANDSNSLMMAKVLASGFPAGAVGIAHFDAMVKRAGAKNILTLNKCYDDPTIPALIVSQIGLEASTQSICRHLTECL